MLQYRIEDSSSRVFEEGLFASRHANEYSSIGMVLSVHLREHYNYAYPDAIRIVDDYSFGLVVSSTHHSVYHCRHKTSVYSGFTIRIFKRTHNNRDWRM